MRIQGRLKKWNDDRGFGFVAPPQSDEEIFVHISAFPRGGTRPCIGEMLSFEVRTGNDGRRRAEGVVRPGAAAPPRERRNASGRRRQSLFAKALAVMTIGVIGGGGYLISHQNQATAGSDSEGALSQQAVATPAETFKCDGRTHCSQMRSCAEARYFLQHCPGVQMDGDNDGEPCEQQFCN